MRFLKSVIKTVNIILALTGLFHLPLSLLRWQEAAEPWKRVFAVVFSTDTLIQAFILALYTYGAFITVRFFYNMWRKRKRSKWFKKEKIKRRDRKNQEWAKDKTVFTIWEAACFIKGVPPMEYEKDLIAQGITTEILSRVQQNIIQLASENSLLEQKLKNTGSRATIESFLNREEVERLKYTDILKEWLPLVYKMNKQRS